MPNNVWDEVPDWGGVGALRLDRAEAGLGASVWELQPGASQFVYHFHHGSDELLVVLRGTPTVRMHGGDRALREGEVVSFPRGPAGGHQIRNDGDQVARVLIVSSNASPGCGPWGRPDGWSVIEPTSTPRREPKLPET
jgi:mannose-6-phosphate isomerase-like protein (cupin superfamily)